MNAFNNNFNVSVNVARGMSVLLMATEKPNPYPFMKVLNFLTVHVPPDLFSRVEIFHLAHVEGVSIAYQPNTQKSLKSICVML